MFSSILMVLILDKRANRKLRRCLDRPVARLLWREAVYYDASETMSEAVRTMLRMNAEATQETAPATDAGFLWDFWYPAARSTEIRGQKLVTAMLLEVP